MRGIRGKNILILPSIIIHWEIIKKKNIYTDIIGDHYHFRKIINTKLLYCFKKEQKEIELPFNVSSIFISLH